MPIAYPQLTVEDEKLLAAEVIGRIAGPMTLEIVNGYVESYRELAKLIAAGSLTEPVCPEITNANPSSPPIVVAEAFTGLVADQAYRINQIPQRDLIAFANLFQEEQRPATKATTTLRFTFANVPGGGHGVVAIGTEVTSADGAYVFLTTETKQRDGNGTLDVAAERNVTGHTLLSPSVLTKMVSSPAYATAVTNPAAIDSGSELEDLDKTLERVRQRQRRGQRVVSAQDLEDAILDDGLAGNGIVRVFEQIENGDFTSGEKRAGYTTMIVMTRTGDPIDDTARIACAQLIDTVVGNQFIYLVDPVYVTFNVTANVRLKNGVLQATVLRNVEANLRGFYTAAASRFGKGIYRGDIIALIEGTDGVDHIPDGEISSPLVDAELQEYQMPKLVNVTLTAV